MAAVDRRMPCLDDFVGLNWSCWVDTVNNGSSDVVYGVGDSSLGDCHSISSMRTKTKHHCTPKSQSEDTKSGRGSCETMTLRKEDMPIYGHCPAQDNFYLVVCSHCGKLVKPQAFEEHCNRRHHSLSKTCVLPSSTPLHQPCTSRPSQTVTKERPRDSRVSSSSQRRPSKPVKGTSSLPTEGKTIQDRIIQDKSQPALTPRPKSQPQPPVAPVQNHARPSSSSSSSPSLSSMKPTGPKPPPAQTHSPQRDQRAYTHNTLRNSNSKTSINKKCEDQDKMKPSLQQPIQTGDLSRQQKSTDSEIPTVASLTRDSDHTVKSESPDLQSDPKEHWSNFTLNTNSHTSRPKDPSETFPIEESPVEVHPPYPFNQSLPSSDSSDHEEEHADVPSTPWHPKPLGMCTFGCRAFGCSVFTFDRRLHHLRIALSAMLEDHVNSHLWKNIPQPASNLKSALVTPPARGLQVHIGAKSNPTGSFNVKSTSLERLKNAHNNSKRTKLAPSPFSASLGQQSSVGQTSKSHMGPKQLMQNVKTQKQSSLTHTKLSKLIASPNSRVPDSLSKKTPQLSPLRPSERNGPLSNESLPPNPCPPRSKGRPPGTIPSRAGMCDDRALVQKRKHQSSVPPTSSSPSKKCARLSPPSRSSLFSWKRDSTQDVWLGVWRKEHTSEDDASGHY